MTRIRFIVEKGNKGPDNVTMVLSGMEELPKYLMITSDDFTTPIGTGKAFIENGFLVVEAELKEDDFRLNPAIGFESLEEEVFDGNIIVKRSILHSVSLREAVNGDPELLSVSEQLNSGEALLMYY